MHTARESVKLVDPSLVTVKYEVWCRRKNRTPESGEWLSWVLRDEEQAQAEAKRIAAEKAKPKKWYDVAD